MRTCLACGYDLFGHGDEPRCPECGLLNIPEGYRRQVWELVDSGKWFFSGPFQLFRKRPPGWWWALDRPDDLRRAIMFALKNAVVSGLIVLVAVCVASSIALEVTQHYRVFEKTDPDQRTVYEADETWKFGWTGVQDLASYKPPAWDEIYSATRAFSRTSTSRLVVVPNAWGLLSAGLGACWLVLVWAMPAFVGLVTQLRKGLPSFARPPLTILAASAQESHRLVYNAIALVPAVSLQSYIAVSISARAWVGNVAPNPMMWVTELGVGLAMMLYAAAGWIGPLRSDYTRQLIRSRFHAGRIVIMYALLLPLIFTLAVASLITILAGGS